MPRSIVPNELIPNMLLVCIKQCETNANKKEIPHDKVNNCDQKNKQISLEAALHCLVYLQYAHFINHNFPVR